MTEVRPTMVSVVVPTRNDARNLRQAIESVACQTMRPSEIVVVDDASTDATPNVVAELKGSLSGNVTIRSIRLASPMGSEHARNLGAKRCSGSWIAGCDSDDLWAETKLEEQLSFINNWAGSEPLVALGTQGYNVNTDGRIISPLTLGLTSEHEFVERRRRFELLWLSHTSVIVSRDAFVRAGGYRLDYKGAEDLDLWSRLAELGVVINLDQRLVYYRKRRGSMQHTLFWDQQDNLLRVSENMRRRSLGQPELTLAEFRRKLRSEPLRSRLRRRRLNYGKYLYRSGSTDVVNGRRLRGASALMLAAALDPRRVKSGAQGALRQLRGVQPPAKSN